MVTQWHPEVYGGTEKGTSIWPEETRSFPGEAMYPLKDASTATWSSSRWLEPDFPAW